MKPEFNELQFSNSINFEIQQTYFHHLIRPPIFPSPRQETSYDVKFPFSGFSLFFQYKVSEYMVRANAREYNYYSGSYFRFNLYQKNGFNQHNLLCGLSLSGENAYYCAPRFYQQDEWIEYYLNQQTTVNSVCIDPREIGIINDNNPHRITYHPQNNWGGFHTENKKIDKVLSFEDVFTKLKEKPHKIDIEYLEKLFLKVKEILEKLDRQYKKDFDILQRIMDSDLHVTHKLHIIFEYFNIQWYIIRIPPGL